MATISLDEFIAKYNEQDVNFPNCDTNQCMTLMHAYVQEVVGIEDPLTLATAHAKDVYNTFDTLINHDKFQLVAQTPEGVPVKGDIMVYDAPYGEYQETNETGEVVTKHHGHVDIFVNGDVNSYDAFSANDPLGTKPHLINHANYVGVLGWLHPLSAEEQVNVVPTPPISDNEYKGLDLNNIESVKAAVDAWYEVAHGAYIKADEHQAAINSIAERLGVAPDLDVIGARIEELKNKPAEQVEVVKEVPADASTIIHPKNAEKYPQIATLWHELTAFLKDFVEASPTDNA